MALHTNVLHNGEWVTQTIDVYSILSKQTPSSSKKQTTREQLPPPTCGLLTTTISESPHIKHILPVRLRSLRHNDVAIIGEYYIQICELGPDGRLKEVIRRNDFDCQIRNACVIGTFSLDDLREASFETRIKTEEDEFCFSAGPAGHHHPLPPQLLAVFLENGEIIFMFVRENAERKLEFVTGKYEDNIHHALSNDYSGFYVAVDPSSRYMAMASVDYIVIYELEEREVLAERYSRGQPLKPVKTHRLRHTPGSVVNMTFLYPQLGHPGHIILLMIIANNGRPKGYVLDWILGEKLPNVVSRIGLNKFGIPPEHCCPTLLIPLRVESAYISVSGKHLALVTGAVHGAPIHERLSSLQNEPPAFPYHNRTTREPLWVAWARPLRYSSFYSGKDSRGNPPKDFFYLARHDGLVIHIEAKREDQDSVSLSLNILESFPCSMDVGLFACLCEDQAFDILVLGSTNGPGGYWKTLPLGPVVFLGELPYWGPVYDFTTTDEFIDCEGGSQHKAMVPWQEGTVRRPDRVFAAVDMGKKGAIVEYRYGLKADIGLDIDWPGAVKRVWLVSGHHPFSHQGYLLLLSGVDRSAAVYMSYDFGDAEEKTVDDGVPFDLSSPTFAMACSAPMVVQVTRQSIVLAAYGRSIRVPVQEISGLVDAEVSDACIRDDCIALSVLRQARYVIQILKIDTSTLRVAPVHELEVDGEVTALGLDADYTLLVGVRRNLQTSLDYCSLTNPLGGFETVNLTEYLVEQIGPLLPEGPPVAEGIADILPLKGMVLLGTRSGEVIILRNVDGSVLIESEKFGSAVAHLTYSSRSGENGSSVLITCDNALVSMSLDVAYTGTQAILKSKKHRVWPVDSQALHELAPPVQFAMALDVPADDSVTPLLMVSSSRLLLAELHHTPGLVNRVLTVNGTPTRVMYSHAMQSLIVGMVREGRPDLVFLHPDTGEHIGRPQNKQGAPIDSLQAFDKFGDRIFTLTEWTYKKDHGVWNLLLIGLKMGLLLVVRMDKDTHGGHLTIRYRLLYKRDYGEPVYSAIGYDAGIVCCAGDLIRWEVLDPEDKKLRPLREFPINSPGIALRIANGKLFCLTKSDSLAVLEHGNGTEPTTKLCHVDPYRTESWHMIMVESPEPEQQQQQHSAIEGEGSEENQQHQGKRGAMVLTADRFNGIGATWVPWLTKEQETHLVVNSELRVGSIRRFRRGRTRPVWQQYQGRCRPRYGRLAATIDDADILAVTFLGSVIQMSLLNPDAWRLLKYIANLAFADEEICPYLCFGEDKEEQARVRKDPEPREEAEERWVDGDLLRRVVERGILGRLVRGREERVKELLGKVEGRERENVEAVVRGVEEVLGYYLEVAL